MKIFVIGTRGILGIQGGVETHCEKLYPRLASSGLDITVIRRTPYVNNENKKTQYKGVKIKDLYAPRKKSIEVIIHTFIAVLYSFIKKVDVIHIHSIGPAIFTPLARLLGMKVVITHHGADYEREKWGAFAKTILRLGEKMAFKYSNSMIVVSDEIYRSVIEKYGNRDNLSIVYNGVDNAHFVSSSNYIRSLGLESRKYIFALGRFVEEKGFQNLIQAYSKSHLRHTYRLVLAGDGDHNTAFVDKLKKQALDNDVVLTGFVRGDHLDELFTYARLFILPSFHEGLPIALLEAMSFALPILASDIPVNRMLMADSQLFDPADVNQLVQKIENELSKEFTSQCFDLSEYNWDVISDQTYQIIQSVEKK